MFLSQSTVSQVIFKLLTLLVAGMGIIPLLSAQVPGAKCAPTLLWSAPRSAAQELFVVVVNDVPAFEKQVKKNLPEVNWQRSYLPAGVVLLQCPRAVLLEKILPMPNVLFADLGFWAGKEERAVPGHNLFANHISYVHTRQPALDGSGTTISIKEFRFDSTDTDLKNRTLLTGKSAPTLTIHAGLIATLAAGAGNSDSQARGVAQGSRLVSSSFVGLLPDDDADYTAFDISVQNHSYGLDIENYYGAGALAYDQSTLGQPDLLHVFSAGNRGADTSPTGAYTEVHGFANLTGNFKMAKNVLVVGAVDSVAKVQPFSSRGPAYDGRIKPDLVAFGQNGSSEATALVSGAAAVVRQAFFEKYDYWPESDLVRAILIGSCTDLGLPGPDFTGGYGNLNLKKAVELVQHRVMAVGAVANGESRVFEIGIPPHAQQVTATLCWNDVPAVPNAARAIVNDLDLTVLAPDGTLRQPWVLHAHPHRDSLLLPARTGRDSLNTVEQVTLVQPPPGTYQITVNGNVLSGGNQPFALAIYWDTLQHFEWLSPVQNDPATAGKEVVLRWESTWATDIGILEWKPVGSTSWETLTAAAHLGPGYRKWLLPDTFEAAQVRMQVQGSAFVSDTFLIAPTMRVWVDFNCPDSLLLRWSAVSPTALYRVWALGDRYLEPLFITTDTALVLQKNTYPQERFAVSVLKEGTSAEGVRISSPHIAPQGGICYINNLLALLNGQQVDLVLDLGALYGVRRIYLEKLQGGGVWMVLHEENPTNLQVLSADYKPDAGKNTYRARLEMENGGELVGEPVEVYYSGSAGYLVLPNPVLPGQSLTVLAQFSDKTPRFRLFDVLGRQMLEEKLQGEQSIVALPALPPGCYVWMIAGEGTEQLARGVLVVRR